MSTTPNCTRRGMLWSFGVTSRLMVGKRLSRNVSRDRGIVAEQRINCLRVGVARSTSEVVVLLKERSRRESASSTTICVTRERMLGSFSAMLERRWGVETTMSMPFGLKRRLRMTVGDKFDEIGADLYLTVWPISLTTLPTCATSSEEGSSISARGRPMFE